eukprot:g29209.t1
MSHKLRHVLDACIVYQFMYTIHACKDRESNIQRMNGHRETSKDNANFEQYRRIAVQSKQNVNSVSSLFDERGEIARTILNIDFGVFSCTLNYQACIQPQLFLAALAPLSLLLFLSEKLQLVQDLL